MLPYLLVAAIKKRLLILPVLFTCATAFGQVSVTGAQCVLPGMIYQYDIKGDWKPNDKISICVDGGILTGSGTSCINNQESVSYVRLQWNGGISTGKISVTSQTGTANLSVTIASPFDPGFIETTDKQTISYNKRPPSLSCTQASGGTCSPSFSYQWEQSADKLRWTEISGATGRNLSFDTPLQQTTFFRRKVIESGSQTTGYSNEITVFVLPESKKQ